MPVNKIYAHSLPERPASDWEELSTHLHEVADQCSNFTAAFISDAWGRVLGQCHDLGKASARFQAMLHRALPESANASEEDQAPGRVDHSTYGARYIQRIAGDSTGITGLLLAYAVAGHHAGLADWNAAHDQDRSTLPYRLAEDLYRISEVPDPCLNLPSLPIPWQIDGRGKGDQSGKLRRAAFSYALFTRMIFSCLIDADRLCTERFCDPRMAAQRQRRFPALATLRSALNAHMRALQNEAPSSPVNSARRSVHEQCLAAAGLSPGFFSLQVPTGGGKTLASLAFALHHATYPGRQIQRVIVAIPFTTIIEQTADVYRSALGSLGEAAVLEHHTNLRPERNTRASQMATENWDAPLIVTTNVQFLESLFASRTTPCRKLHRIAHSVVILDEAQTLPTDLLEPTLAALRELVEHYGCSIVLCTATQPALEHRDNFPIGIEGMRPIIVEPAPLFQALHRVAVRLLGAISDDDLTHRLAAEHRVLCIVNTRAHARNLFGKISFASDPDSCFHLSTLMCGAHRRSVLQLLRHRLKYSSQPTRIVSTQLVEAGVDIDLPAVYRAAAGIDSIAQAAGRCNREGRLTLGNLYLFEAEAGVPAGFLRQAAETGREVLRRHQADPLSLRAVEDYFHQLYWRRKDEWDAHEIMAETDLALDHKTGNISPKFNFRVIENKFQLIRDAQVPVLIPYNDEALGFVELLANGTVEFLPQRQLQPYLVNIPKQVLEELASSGSVLSHSSGLGLLLRKDAYDAKTGLTIERLPLDSNVWGV